MELSLETHVPSGQLAVHGLAILLGRNEAGISNRGKFFFAPRCRSKCLVGLTVINFFLSHFCHFLTDTPEAMPNPSIGEYFWLLGSANNL